MLNIHLRSIAKSCSLMGNINKYTSYSSLFYCEFSHKRISKHRLIDGITDCYYEEDENYSDSCLLNDTQRFPCTSEEKCLSPLGIGSSSPDCKGKEDKLLDNHQQLIFTRLCNHIPDFLLEDNESDEDNCEWWPCNNPYTRCDNVYQCANGIDELGCPNFNCNINEFKCRIKDSNNYQCVPLSYIYEKPLNCSNYDDHGIICRNLWYSSNATNNKNEYFSWKEKTCLTKSDVCGWESADDQHLVCNMVERTGVSICDGLLLNMYNNEEVCMLTNSFIPLESPYFFSTLNLGYLPLIINTTLLFSQQHTDIKITKTISTNNSIELLEYCNRGILIFEDKSYEKKCLCPPNYFGNQCQWQSQRVSLTLQIRKLGSIEKTHSIYDIFIYLIDDKYRIIHYYEEIIYNPSLDCETKFNRYLLYPTRPKNKSHNYSIHIDIYDKITLNYYASWYLFIPFPFLPVNRLATKIIIPADKSEPSTNCSLECGVHGKCFDYINSSKSFCLCDQGYSGGFCNLTYQCSCSPDSICLNSSICLCPSNKFGSKCYLKHTFCLTQNPCKNNGKCIPVNDRVGKGSFICLCTEYYMGSYCEYNSNRIDITFNTNIIPTLIFAHFITAFDYRQPERIVKFKKIPFDEQTITIFSKQAFHIIIIEFLNNYYLTVLREKFIPSENISTDINVDNMCINISKLLNSTILDYEDLHRIKYYQLPCLENVKLKCFFDDKYMCICDKNRYSSCLHFIHNMTYDCRGYNHCKNNGTCFQDNATCPTTSVCMCPKCYYGSKCQWDTKGFSLSLDAIFGYHIKPSISFLKQSKAVKITATLTFVILLLGFINGLLSILTFRRESSLENGCGIYLLSASVVSLLTLSTFTIKYWQLVLFQMNVIRNRSFIYANCLLTDMLLKAFLSSGDWLNACVAIERAYIVIRGMTFNKLKSRLTAKCVIPILFLLTAISYIHDPLNRQLFDDEDADEQRILCIANYSSKIKLFDTSINLFHFLTPFAINFLSALIIIVQIFYLRSKTQTQLTRYALMSAQVKRHKHLLISACVLILLALPRLIISFLFNCIESARDPWLFLTSYYISFIPPLLTLIVFVLPSEKYKNEFLIVIRKRHEVLE